MKAAKVWGRKDKGAAILDCALGSRPSTFGGKGGVMTGMSWPGSGG
jgi:hypothetical protein